ncbi:hypothetical protein BH10PLA2_BH10PLA2_10680 [soil metagenome]
MASAAPTVLPPQIQVEPGYKTTEFWQSLLTQLLAAAVALVSMLRERPTGQNEQWSSTINQLVPVVASLLAAFGANQQYVARRTELKLTTAQANAQMPQPVTQPTTNP